MKKVFLFLLLSPVLLFAQQTKPVLSFQASYVLHAYKMTDLNKHYFDNYAIPIELFKESINGGQSAGLTLNFHIHPGFDLGIYAFGQRGKVKGASEIIETDDFGNAIATHEIVNTFTASALSYGLSNQWHLNHFLGLNNSKSKVLNNLRLSLGWKLGLANSTALIKHVGATVPFPGPNVQLFKYNAGGLHFQPSFSLKYRISNNPIISALGFEFGYQLLKTKTLQDDAGFEWRLGDIEAEEAKAINLDFSGWFVGMVLSLGQ